MHILFLFGWVLLIVAFGAAASEPFMVVTNSGRAVGSSVLTSAYDLWYAMDPGHLVLSKIKIENISPVIWDPILISLLYLPAWFILGVPGVLLAWFCRPNRAMSAEVREEYERQKESLFVIDVLNQEAKSDETWHPSEDDRAPVHQLFDLEKSEDEDIRNSLLENDIPAGYPSEEDFMGIMEDDPEQVDLEQLYAEIERHEQDDKHNTDK